MERTVVPDFYIAVPPWWSPDIGESDGCGAGQRVGWVVHPPDAWWLAHLPGEAPSLDAIHRGGALPLSDGSMSGPIACHDVGRWQMAGRACSTPPAPGLGTDIGRHQRAERPLGRYAPVTPRSSHRSGQRRMRRECDGYGRR